MAGELTRYPRRQFLRQCAAACLAGQIATTGEQTIAGEEHWAGVVSKASKRSETDLAREVESLLKVVDPRLHDRHVPATAENDAWPMWEEAGQAYVEQPKDREFCAYMHDLLDQQPRATGEVRHRVLDWIRQNEECRKLIGQGISRGSVEWPREGKSVRLPFMAHETLRLVRRLAQLKHSACCARLSEGDVDGALSEAFGILKMGTMLVHAECMIIDYLVAQYVFGVGVRAVYQAATAPSSSDDQARAAINNLAAVKPTREDFKRAHRVELCRGFVPSIAGFPNETSSVQLATHCVTGDLSLGWKPTEWQLQECKRCIERVATLLEGHPNPLDKKATVRLYSEMHLRHFKQMGKPWLKRDHGKVLRRLEKELAAWPSEMELDTWLFGEPESDSDQSRKLTDRQLRRARDTLRSVDNVLGKYLVKQSTSEIMAITALEIHQARLEAARIRIALRLYERQNGRLPERLDGLVEAGRLPEVPQDPYDGDPFRYSAERRVVWSVGPEGTSQGLVPKQQDPENPFKEDDALVWQIRPCN